MDQPYLEPLAKFHDKTAFSCGVPALDNYLRKQATQDIRRKVATAFVAVGEDGATVLGYYTLSMSSLSLADVPKNLARRLPHYPLVPAIRLGRLAVSLEAQGRGLGKHLLMDALHRSLTNEIAWAVFLVDAVDENARSFYLPFGFQSLADDAKHLFLPRRTIERAFGNKAP